jgi:hypothetical protein
MLHGINRQGSVAEMSPARYELGFISQKTFFIVTAVKTSNLT